MIESPQNNTQYKKGDCIQFIKHALVFNLNDNSSFYLKEGTVGEVVTDTDVGENGSCQIKLNTDQGQEIVVQTNDQNIALF